jgi:hypothetical protein
LLSATLETAEELGIVEIEVTDAPVPDVEIRVDDD